MHSEISIELCTNWWFGCIDKPDRQFVNSLVPTPTPTWSDGPELLLILDRPDRSNYFNYYNDGGKNTSCCTGTDCMLLTSPVVADTYPFLMNTWKTLPESYQHRVYKNTLATVKRQTQQAKNPMPAVVISVEVARVDNVILHDYLTSKVVLGEPEIGSTDQNIPIDNNCMDDELHFGKPGGSGEYDDDGDKNDDSDAIPTDSLQLRASTEL